jgi:hypothetical protein
MSDSFNRALSGMVSEVAYRRAVRHLFDSGLEVDEIVRALTYPAGRDQVEREIEAYIREKDAAEREGDFEYVAVTDRYGRNSYIKRKKGSV